MNNHDSQYSSWFHQFIEYVIWYLILNISFIIIGYPLTETGEPSKLRAILFLIVCFFFLGTWLGIINLLARKIGFLKSLLLAIPSSLIVNFVILKLYNFIVSIINNLV